MFFVGCAYNPGPNLNAPGKTVPAKPGSTYTFKNVQTDTTGKAIDSTLYYSKDSIAEVGITYNLKTNVTHIVSVDPVSGFSYGDTYINYETNGDISIYSGASGSFGGVTLPPWRTYAVQSHTTAGAKFADTTVTLPQIPIPVHITAFDTLSYVNSGTYANGTNNIPVFNMRDVLTENGSALILSLTLHTVSHLAFAPSLGYVVSQITDPTISPNTTYIPSFGGSEMTLTGYILK